jgi:hypothetical protein
VVPLRPSGTGCRAGRTAQGGRARRARGEGARAGRRDLRGGRRAFCEATGDPLGEIGRSDSDYFCFLRECCDRGQQNMIHVW